MRRRTGLAGCLLALAVSACAASVPGSGAAGGQLGFVIVTTGGTALSSGDSDVPPTLDLRIRAGRALSPSDAAVALDGHSLSLAAAAGALTASVPAMALASAHRLDLSLPGRDQQRIAFHVVAPVAAHAAWHRDPQSGAVLDVAFALAPDHAAVERVLPAGGSRRWVDDRHLRLVWPAAPGGALDLPAGIPTARGSQLAAELRLDLGQLPPAGALRSADVPDAGAEPRQPLVVAFSVGSVRSRASVVQHLGQTSVLSPTGVTAEADGGLSGSPDPPTAAAAAGSGVALLPLVQLFDSAKITALLADGPAVSRLAGALGDRADAGRWGGVQLDVENIPGTARDQFSRLVAAIAARLHAGGRKLAVDVVPHRSGRLTAASVGYDLGAIARSADWVVLMAYPENSEAPGPVAGRDWQEQLLAGSLPELGDPSRVILAVPLYGCSWPGGGCAATADAYDNLVSRALAVPGARIDYDFAGATPFIATPEGALTYFDDAASLARKFALIPEHRLAGVAMWRLGFEDPAVWSVLPASALRP